MEKAAIFVNGMSCAHCENAVKTAVSALQGVDEVMVDLKLKKVTVDYHPEKIDLKSIKDAIEDKGYDIIS